MVLPFELLFYIMQLELFPLENELSAPIDLEELFEAYASCRKNKRNTINAIAFEIDYERELIRLCDEINGGSYHPGKSVAFIVNKPVQREIFAADFRDRIVHHLIISKLNPLFEREFIYDSYACRTGKGTHLGIKRLDRFIRQCSHNYSQDCFILKLDIKAFFMSIHKMMLHSRLNDFLHEKYVLPDRVIMCDLCRKVVLHDPTRNCIIKGRPSDWRGLPMYKSLFHCSPDYGLPIGNLTSQVFANFYLSPFDHFVKHDLGVRYYGRYVDDFVLVHQDKEYLKNLIPRLRNFLKKNLSLTLHPDKVYLQHYSKGVKFLGAIIKPNRIYIANRTKGNFNRAIDSHNTMIFDHKPNRRERESFLSSMNSYLGILKHYKTYRLRRRMLAEYVSAYWWKEACLIGGIEKFVLTGNRDRIGIAEEKQRIFQLSETVEKKSASSTALRHKHDSFKLILRNS